MSMHGGQKKNRGMDGHLWYAMDAKMRPILPDFTRDCWQRAAIGFDGPGRKFREEGETRGYVFR